MEKLNAKIKHLQISPLNANNFIKVNELEEISDPLFFSRSNMPAPRGLLSNEIFGITKDDRTTIFAYIHLAGESFIHPLAYKIWSKLDSNVKLCAYEMGTFKYDKSTGKLAQDPEGETGLKYLKKIIKDVNFQKTASSKRNIRTLFLETYREKLFIENFVVMPAGYRDVDTEQGGRIGVGEINKLYNSIIRDCKALEESDDYGLTLNGSLRGRIQDTIVKVYDWIAFGKDPLTGKDSQATGLSRKLGLIRRAGMKKSFDWGSRLVICQQNLRKESLEDLQVDLDSVGLPLASICANLYPYMIFWIRQWFDFHFSDEIAITAFSVSNKTSFKTKIKDWREVYSDERIKEELDRFMHGMSNRFIPIEAPIADEEELKKEKNPKAKPYLIFKGYMVDDEKYVDEILNDKVAEENIRFPIQERPLTWCDLIYQAAMEVTKDKMTLITRFPVDTYWNQFPAKIKVISTIITEPMIIGNHYYKEYPKIRLEDINKNTTNKFVDVALPNNVRLGSIGGDFDGDTISSKVMYSIESNQELLEAVDMKKHYISLGGENDMKPSIEGLQSLYNLTLVLPDDMKKITDPVF